MTRLLFLFGYFDQVLQRGAPQLFNGFLRNCVWKRALQIQDLWRFSGVVVDEKSSILFLIIIVTYKILYFSVYRTGPDSLEKLQTCATFFRDRFYSFASLARSPKLNVSPWFSGLRSSPRMANARATKITASWIRQSSYHLEYWFSSATGLKKKLFLRTNIFIEAICVC